MDGGSFLITGGGTFTLLLAAFGWRGMAGAFVTLFGRRTSASNIRDAIQLFRLGAAFALGCGFLGTLIGFVIMLQNMSEPSAIGPAIAVSLLTYLYAVVLALFSLVAAVGLGRRQPVQEQATQLDRLARQAVPVAGAATALGVVSVLVIFTTLLLNIFSSYPLS